MIGSVQKKYFFYCILPVVDDEQAFQSLVCILKQLEVVGAKRYTTTTS